MRRAWLVGGVLLAGCGGSEKPATDQPATGTAREQIAAVVHGYLDALAEADGPRACGHLTLVAQDDLTSMTNAPTCEDAVGAMDDVLDDRSRRQLRSAKVTVGAVKGTQASARLASDTLAMPRSIPLEQDDGQWKIAGFEGDVHPPNPQQAQCIAGGMNAFDTGTVPKFWAREGRSDYRDYIVDVCRRAEAAGLMDEDPDSASLRRKLTPIARKVIREMVRRGQIKAP
jgi:hypothetical protein